MTKTFLQIQIFFWAILQRTCWTGLSVQIKYVGENVFDCSTIDLEMYDNHKNTWTWMTLHFLHCQFSLFFQNFKQKHWGFKGRSNNTWPFLVIIVDPVPHFLVTLVPQHPIWVSLIIWMAPLHNLRVDHIFSHVYNSMKIIILVPLSFSALNLI